MVYLSWATPNINFFRGGFSFVQNLVGFNWIYDGFSRRFYWKLAWVQGIYSFIRNSHFLMEFMVWQKNHSKTDNLGNLSFFLRFGFFLGNLSLFGNTAVSSFFLWEVIVGNNKYYTRYRVYTIDFQLM